MLTMCWASSREINQIKAPSLFNNSSGAKQRDKLKMYRMSSCGKGYEGKKYTYKENRKCLEKRWDAILNTMAKEHNIDNVAFEQGTKARSQLIGIKTTAQEKGEVHSIFGHQQHTENKGINENTG